MFVTDLGSVRAAGLKELWKEADACHCERPREAGDTIGNRTI